jgi:hypothetical protein
MDLPGSAIHGAEPPGDVRVEGAAMKKEAGKR